MKPVLFCLSVLTLLSSSAFAECDLQKLRAEASARSNQVEDLSLPNMNGKAYPREVVVTDELLGSDETPLIVTSGEVHFVPEQGNSWTSKFVMVYPVILKECRLDFDNGMDGVTASRVEK